MVSDRDASVERKLVVFTLHGEQYGVPIETVREIVHHTRPTATAAASGLIRGLISLRGEVLPVADLSSRLGREPHPGVDGQIVVLGLDDGSLGLIVDRVDGVRSVARDRITPSPVPGAEVGLGDEIAAIDDSLVLLLDPQRVLGGMLRPATAPAPPATKRSRARKAAKPPASKATKPAKAARPRASRRRPPASP